MQLAACDTFRAGAVEQLKTHAMRLGVSAAAGSPLPFSRPLALLLQLWRLCGLPARLKLTLLNTDTPQVPLYERSYQEDPAKSPSPNPLITNQLPLLYKHRCPCTSAVTRRTPPRSPPRRFVSPSATAATWCSSTPRGACRCAGLGFLFLSSACMPLVPPPLHNEGACRVLGLAPLASCCMRLQGHNGTHLRTTSR